MNKVNQRTELSISKFSLCILLTLVLSSCDNPSQNDIDSLNSPSLAVSAEDFTGERIELDQAAQRIVALAPHIVENVYSAGAGDQLVGVVQYSDYPEAAKSLPIVGGYEKTNLEKILELKPDLIIGWQSGNSHGSLNRLKQLGFPVYIDQADSLNDVAKSIIDIGKLTGHSERAQEVADNYLKELDVTRNRYRSASKVSSFYQVWNSPLQTISGDHIISNAIEICGGVNIYANEFAVAPIINIESVLERDPSAIIASGMSSARPDWLNEWLQWPSMTAVEQGNLFFVNPDYIQRHTIRLLQGIESICTQLEQVRHRRDEPTASD